MAVSLITFLLLIFSTNVCDQLRGKSSGPFHRGKCNRPICAAGPPKEIKPIFNQKLKPSPNYLCARLHEFLIDGHIF